MAILIKCESIPLEVTRPGWGIVTHDHTMTLCHYLLMMIETSTVWTPTCVHMIVDNRRNSGAVKWSRLTLRQLRQEMGVDVGSRRPNSAIGGFCIFPQSFTRPPALAVTHTHTHMLTRPSPPRLAVFYPLEVRVWYQPICSNHPRNPNGLAQRHPRSSQLLPAPIQCAPQRSDSHTKTRRGERSQRGSDRRVKWAEEREAADIESCSDARLTDTGILKNLPLITVRSSGRWLSCVRVCSEVIRMAVAGDGQDNMSGTAVAPSLRCSHFKVKCVETHLTNEAHFQAKTATT